MFHCIIFIIYISPLTAVAIFSQCEDPESKKRLDEKEGRGKKPIQRMVIGLRGEGIPYGKIPMVPKILFSHNDLSKKGIPVRISAC